MRKFVISAMLCAFASIGSAQLDATIAPLGLLWGDFNVAGDFVFNDNISAELAFGLGGKSQEQYDYRNVNFQCTGKYYFNPDNGGDKFYSGAFLRYINRKYEYVDSYFYSDFNQSRVGGGVIFGYKLAGDSNFIFDVNLGVGRAFSDKIVFTENDGTEETVEWIDLMVVGRIALGYRIGK